MVSMVSQFMMFIGHQKRSYRCATLVSVRGTLSVSGRCRRRGTVNHVTVFDEKSFDNLEFTKQHFWIALGSLEAINYLIAKNPAEHIIEYKRISPFGSWNIRFGTWKRWAPIAPAVFPGIAIETSDIATGNYLTEWLDGCLAVQKHFFYFSVGKLNTVVVDYAD
jgi:hypothetical protein